MDTQAISSNAPSVIAKDSTPVLPRAALGTGRAAPVGSPGDAVADEAKEPSSVDVRPRDSRSLNFQVDKDTRKVVVTIVDDDNKLVIRQIPDAEMLRIAREIDRLQGFLLDSKA